VKKRGKRVLLISLGAGFGVVLGAIAFAFSVVKEDAPYEFMRGARQDGFYAPIMNGSPEVNRSYLIERDFKTVVEEGRAELASGRGWKENAFIGVTFYDGEQACWIMPVVGDPTRTSVVVVRDATKVEEILGTVYESIPERHADWR
jgi:hypothetical protein